LLVTCVVDGLFGRVDVSAFQGRGGSTPTDVNAYLHIGADGRVTCLVGKVEMGQGAQTSLPQLAAEELDVPLSSIDIVMGDTDLCPYDAGTWGSLRSGSGPSCVPPRPKRRRFCCGWRPSGCKFRGRS
jgi:CO/xanthine dehydrogenase Mo-binding subunit